MEKKNNHFEVGDTVIIKEGLIDYSSYNDVMYLDQMKFNGTSLISGVTGKFIRLEHTDLSYSKDMLELVEIDKIENKINSSVETFKQLQQEELEMYILKNDKYGDSFGTSIRKYGMISALTRMSDKWNRIENLMLSKDFGTDDESIIDSLMDLSNYANMTIMQLMNDEL